MRVRVRVGVRVRVRQQVCGLEVAVQHLVRVRVRLA